MNRILLAGAWLVYVAMMCAAPHQARAQATAVVVATCGTPPVTYATGKTRATTQNTAGNLCTSASASGTFTDDATGTTGNQVPGSAAYTGLNVGGNLVGQTGVNPSGSVQAAQVDLASVAGVTVKTGNGTAAGAIRVALPTDGTGVVGLIAGTAVIGHVIVDTAPTTAVTNAGTFAVQADGTGHTTTQTGSTVTTHGTFQSALASSGTRKGCMVQNTSADTEYVFFGATGSATASNSFQLAPGQSISCVAGNTILTDNVAISSKTTDGVTYAVAAQ